MIKTHVLLFQPIEGGLAKFASDAFQIDFQVSPDLATVPLSDGALWAFVDWILPDFSGLEACRRLRCDPRTAQAQVTMALEEDSPEDRRRALRAGADDYLMGPLTRTIVLDRILSTGAKESEFVAREITRLGDLTVENNAFRALWQDKPIPLMPNEFRLLRYFVEHPGRVFSRTQLIAALGKQAPAIDERTVDVWVGRLRAALRNAGAGDQLRTVRSLGYVLDTP
ncbi:response regulator transcription factor [Novosphingobium sp. Gsoil 351]|uniref:response regulator transcription factor n=1 Tax=Novosphingobium sp. Gsoil 351 TaxID=2675225 RepID=UPI0012B477BC|nr:response regulator transcription factor [Novosphingobium sp. Gsoil 351]QGN53383.1 response regulator [Novosphingobium sp. Gsoil 351]